VSDDAPGFLFLTAANKTEVEDYHYVKLKLFLKFDSGVLSSTFAARSWG